MCDFSSLISVNQSKKENKRKHKKDSDLDRIQPRDFVFLILKTDA